MPWARAVRPPVPCGPCGAGSTGWNDRRGSACGGGSRAPCDGGGCSAGRYACSRQFLRRFRGMSTPQRIDAGCSAGTAHPRGRLVADRGHAAPVDMERPANGTRWGNGGSNPRRRLEGLPVDDVLPRTSCGCYVPCLRSGWKPRSPQARTRVTTSVYRFGTPPLTCMDAVPVAQVSLTESPDATPGPSRSQLVENSVDQGSPEVRVRHTQR